MRPFILALLLITLFQPFPAAASGVADLAERLANDGIGGAESFPAVVTPAIGANVRRGVWGQVITALPRGTRVEVVGREAEFYRVRHDGGVAFIHGNCLAPLAGGLPGSAPPAGPATPGSNPNPVPPAAPPAGILPPVAPPEVRIPDPAPPAATATRFSGFPRRAADAESGEAFLERTAGMSRADREREIERAILAGNVPAALREFRDVRVTMRLADGREHTAVYRVAPDYLAVGDGASAVRMPMNPLTAQRIADRLGCVLPTRLMVDQIYGAADRKLAPEPMSNSRYPDWQRAMMTNRFYGEHDRLIDRQLAGGSGLIAGHKKDVVVSNRLDAKPGSVAIYGWHQRNGRPIQGLSTVHENTYADYSHGVRLVAGTMTVDGREMSTADVMRDPVLSRLLSDEGAIRDPRAAR